MHTATIWLRRPIVHCDCLADVQVSVLFWTMAELDLRHAELASGLTTAVRRHLESMRAEEAAHILASMAALSVRDRWLVESLCTVLLNRLHHEETLRPRLAVATLSAVATVRDNLLMFLCGRLVLFRGSLCAAILEGIPHPKQAA